MEAKKKKRQEHFHTQDNNQKWSNYNFGWILRSFMIPFCVRCGNGFCVGVFFLNQTHLQCVTHIFLAKASVSIPMADKMAQTTRIWTDGVKPCTSCVEIAWMMMMYVTITASTSFQHADKFTAKFPYNILITIRLKHKLHPIIMVTQLFNYAICNQMIKLNHSPLIKLYINGFMALFA